MIHCHYQSHGSLLLVDTFILRQLRSVGETKRSRKELHVLEREWIVSKSKPEKRLNRLYILILRTNQIKILVHNQYKRNSIRSSLWLSCTLPPPSLDLRPGKRRRQQHTAGSKGGAGAWYLLCSHQCRSKCQDACPPLGNAVATEGDQFCIKTLLRRLERPGTLLARSRTSCYRRNWSVISLDLTTQKTLLRWPQDQKKISMTIWYFNVHSEMCPDGEIQGRFFRFKCLPRGLLNKKR
jgi:hypothetical protein